MVSDGSMGTSTRQPPWPCITSSHSVNLPGMMSYGLRLNVVPASSRQTGIEPGVPSNAAGFGWCFAMIHFSSPSNPHPMQLGQEACNCIYDWP